MLCVRLQSTWHLFSEKQNLSLKKTVTVCIRIPERLCSDRSEFC